MENIHSERRVVKEFMRKSCLALDIIWAFLTRIFVEIYRFFLCLFIGLPLLGILRILRPWKMIRVGKLMNSRLGHLMGNSEFWLRKQSLQKENPRELNIFFSRRPINRQVFIMLKRKMSLWENAVFTDIHDNLRSMMKKSPVWIEFTDPGFGSFEIWNNTSPQLYFTEEELRKGKEFLNSLGVSQGHQYICFFVRDKAYMNAMRRNPLRPDLWDYHNYRNSDVNNYMPAAEFLAEQGLWALRMGKIVEKAIASNNSRIIDYATKFQSDFADVYLMAHCKFCLGDSAGLFMLSAAFNVPCALANITPLGYAGMSPKDLFIIKKYRHIESGRFLTFREIIARGADTWLMADAFKNAGIEVVENSSDEILDLALEMNERLNGTWKPGDEDDILQERYRALFDPGHPMRRCPSRVGAMFLRQNKKLME